MSMEMIASRSWGAMRVGSAACTWHAN
jgi:hypothetical protein